jgi:hypothetical protein
VTALIGRALVGLMLLAETTPAPAKPAPPVTAPASPTSAAPASKATSTPAPTPPPANRAALPPASGAPPAPASKPANAKTTGAAPASVPAPKANPAQMTAPGQIPGPVPKLSPSKTPPVQKPGPTRDPIPARPPAESPVPPLPVDPAIPDLRPEFAPPPSDDLGPPAMPVFLLPTGAEVTVVPEAQPPAPLRNALLPEEVNLRMLELPDPINQPEPGDAGYPTSAFATSFLSKVEGPSPSFGGRALFTLDPAAEDSKSLALYLRGFYSFVTGGPHDWSGTELAIAGRPAEGVHGAVVFHHELREQVGDMLMASMSVRLEEGFYALGSFAAGFSADYLPITWLEGETRKVVAPSLRVGGGLGASFWQNTRRHAYVLASGFYTIRPRLALEQRFVAGAIMAQDMSTRLNLQSSTSVVWGRHGGILLEGRFSFGDGPLYRPGISETFHRDRLNLDLGAGIRSWLGKYYGYALNLDLGHQRGIFSRIGMDVSLFVEL